MVEAKRLVGAIRDQVGALDALTEEYLAFARFPRPQFEEDSVNEMVGAVTEFMRPLATRQGITVDLETDPAVPAMAIDRSLLRQAVLNLIKNGLEALSQGGALTLTTRRLDDTVEIGVSDTGPGISEEVGGRLFEQFFTTKPQGSGLGLSITRQIAEGHGGQVRWTSQPGARRDLLHHRSPSREPNMPDTARLLVADDDPAVRQSLERILAREGYQVVLAPDGQAAAERLRQGAWTCSFLT